MALNYSWKQFFAAVTRVTSALDIHGRRNSLACFSHVKNSFFDIDNKRFSNEMRYINLRFSYLLTLLSSRQTPTSRIYSKGNISEIRPQSRCVMEKVAFGVQRL